MKTKMKLAVFLIIAGFVQLAFPAESSTPTAADVLKSWEKATGGIEALGQIQSSYILLSVETSGLKGKAESWATIDGRHRDVTDFGDVYRELSVVDGRSGKAWSKDTNGKVRELAGTDLEPMITSAYMDSYSHFFPDRLPGKVALAGEDSESNSYMLRLEPEGGRAVVVYIDKKTGLPSMQKEQQGERTSTVFFSQWQEVNGIRIPFHIRQSTGDPKYDVMIQVEEAKFNVPLAQNLFDVPTEDAPDYKFASGGKALNIPFELNSNHVYLQASVNDSKPIWFLLDTGAGFTVLNEKRARELGMELHGQIEGRGAGEKSTNVSLVKDVNYKLPGVEVFGQNAATISLEPLEGYEGRKMDGILGYDFISRFVVVIDYQKRLIHLYEPSTYQYSGSGKVIPFILQGGMPAIQTKITVQGKDPIEAQFDVDTGARNALVLNKPFHETHQLLQVAGKTLDAPLGFGVGGQTRQLIGHITSFQMGDFLLPDLLVSYAQDEKGANADPTSAGLLGGEILRRFTVVFDYSRNQMILDPNDHFDDPFHYDMSGLNLVAEGADFRSFRILKIVPDSPAAEADLQEGDLLESINGKPASEYTLEQIREMFKQPDAEYRLTFRRNDQGIDAKLRLRPLI